MSAPTPVKLGPGTMKIGAIGTETDMSCLLQNATIAWSVDAEDDTNVLCGDTVPGARTYSATISGNALQDLTEKEGLVAFTWAHKGEAVPLTFTPNDEAGATVTGTVVIDPLDVGGDTYGSVMNSDFEYAFVGEPALAWPDDLAAAWTAVQKAWAKNHPAVETARASAETKAAAGV